MLIESLDITAAEFAAGTGWDIKPQGACKAEVCVPLGGGDFDAASAAERLGMAVVAGEQRRVVVRGTRIVGRPCAGNSTGARTRV